MRGIHQPLKTVRAAITGLHRVRRNAVITPVARAGKSSNWHDFNRGNANIMEIWKPGNNAFERSFGCECCGVELVNYEVLERDARPALV